MERLREEILALLRQGGDERELIRRLNQLICTAGAQACQCIFHVLTTLDLAEKEAADCWWEVLDHREKMNAAMGREVGLRTAMCDYFTTVHRSLKNPKVVELHIFEQTVRQSSYDGLTGLFNRNTFDIALAREIALASRYDKDVSLLFFDIDDFKQINDTMGHHAGDLALKHLAAIVLSEKRTGDIAARYGGEEVVIILPYTSNLEALVLGERIRRRVAATPFACEGREIGFTVSGGLVSFPLDGRTATSLTKHADSAMYRAKGSGKNNISFFSNDKRRYLRVDYVQPVTIQQLGCDADVPEEGESRNISMGGLLFESRRAYGIGQRLQISLKINGSCIYMIGRVVRVETFAEDRHEIGIAISFQEMDQAVKKEIASYLTGAQPEGEG